MDIDPSDNTNTTNPATVNVPKDRQTRSPNSNRGHYKQGGTPEFPTTAFGAHSTRFGEHSHRVKTIAMDSNPMDFNVIKTILAPGL